MSTPSPVPTSMVTVEYQTVGDRPMTRAVTFLNAATVAFCFSRSSSFRNCSFSPTASWESASSSRSS